MSETLHKREIPNISGETIEQQKTEEKEEKKEELP